MMKPVAFISLLMSGFFLPLNHAQAEKKPSPFQGKLVATTWIKDFSTKKAYRIKQYPDAESPILGEMSPRGEEIAYTCSIKLNDGRQLEDLRIISSDGSSERTLLRSASGFNFNWSPDSKFLLVRIVDLPDRIIIDKESMSAWTFDFPEQIQKVLANWWSKNGETILFLSYQENSPDTKTIYKMRLDGSRLEKIMDVDIPYAAGWFELSPDEKKIVGDFGDLFFIDLEKKDAKYLLMTRYVEKFPVWSPDGNWIAYLKTGESYRPTDKWYVRNIDTNKIIEIGGEIPFGVQWWRPPTGEPVVDCGPIVKTLLKGREVNLKEIQKELNKSLPASEKSKP